MHRLPRFTRILAAIFALLAAVAPTQVVDLAAGYEATPITLPFLYTGGNISPDPTDPDSFLVASDFYQSEQIYRVNLGDPLNPVATLLAAGTVDAMGADGVYDNRFVQKALGR